MVSTDPDGIVSLCLSAVTMPHSLLSSYHSNYAHVQQNRNFIRRYLRTPATQTMTNGIVHSFLSRLMGHGASIVGQFAHEKCIPAIRVVTSLSLTWLIKNLRLVDEFLSFLSISCTAGKGRWGKVHANFCSNIVILLFSLAVLWRYLIQEGRRYINKEQ